MPTAHTVDQPQEIYQIQVTLLGTDPPIWRRLLVPADLTLEQLHDVLQLAMGWENYHLHEFRIGRQRFGKPDPMERTFGGPRTASERTARLFSVLGRVGAKAVYTYDFGDSWEHEIVVEKCVASEPGYAYPACLAGERHGPPEDCGGIPGFYNFLEAISDPEHEEHQDLLDWVGGSFAPESFSVDAVNQRLQKKFRPVRKKAAHKPAAQRATRKAEPALHALPNPDLRARSFVPKSGMLRPRARNRIRPGDTIPVELNQHERELILQHTFAGDELTRRFRKVPQVGESLTYHFNLDDLDDLAGYVAAEANHAKDKKMQKRLQALYNRIATLMESYTDEPA